MAPGRLEAFSRGRYSPDLMTVRIWRSGCKYLMQIRFSKVKLNTSTPVAFPKRDRNLTPLPCLQGRSGSWVRRARRYGKTLRTSLRRAVATNADRHAADLADVIADIRAAGHTSLRAISSELNAQCILTRRGGNWHVSNVRNLLCRLDELKSAKTESVPLK